MRTVSRTANCKSSIMVLALTIGLVLLFVSSGVSLALMKKDAIYNECACLCGGPGEGGIVDISNTTGLPCGAYNNKTCNYEDPETGGIRTSTTRYCTGYKPGGTKGAMLAPGIGHNAPVLRRGIEGEQPSEPTPGAPTSPEQPSGTKPQ